jgi:hypothetical protein
VYERALERGKAVRPGSRSATTWEKVRVGAVAWSNYLELELELATMGARTLLILEMEMGSEMMVVQKLAVNSVILPHPHPQRH